jgi:hypothetical protein
VCAEPSRPIAVHRTSPAPTGPTVSACTCPGGLLVGSVIAADPAVPAGDVLAAAEEIVTAEARQRAA